jgi:hypothetical protein
MGHAQACCCPGEVEFFGDNYESSNQLQIDEFICGYVTLLRMIHRRISSSSPPTRRHYQLVRVA